MESHHCTFASKSIDIVYTITSHISIWYASSPLSAFYFCIRIEYIWPKIQNTQKFVKMGPAARRAVHIITDNGGA